MMLGGSKPHETCWSRIVSNAEAAESSQINICRNLGASTNILIPSLNLSIVEKMEVAWLRWVHAGVDVRVFKARRTGLRFRTQKVAGPAGFEPATPDLEGRYAFRSLSGLRYGPVRAD